MGFARRDDYGWFITLFDFCVQMIAKNNPELYGDGLCTVIENMHFDLEKIVIVALDAHRRGTQRGVQVRRGNDDFAGGGLWIVQPARVAWRARARGEQNGATEGGDNVEAVSAPRRARCSRDR